MDDCVGFVKIWHGGRFVGPPIRYENGELCVKYVDSEFTNLLEIRDFVTVELGYADVSIRNIYYKGLFDEMEELKALDGYASFSEICECVKDDAGVEIYVDHQVAFAEVMLELEDVRNEELNDVEVLNVAIEDDSGGSDDEREGFEDVGTQGMDDMGGVTQEVNVDFEEDFFGSSSDVEEYGPHGGNNEEPPVTTTTSEERRSPGQKSKSSAAREKYKEIVRKYKSISFEDEDLNAPNDGPRGRGFPVNWNEELPPEEEDSDFEEEVIEEEDEDSDGPNMLRPYEDSDGEVRQRVWQDIWYNPDTRNPVFKAGMKFKDHDECRKAVRLYAQVTRTNIKHLYNDKRRQKFFCYKCPWKFMASADKGNKCFRLRKYCAYHRCQTTFKGNMMSARELALHFKKRLTKNPFYKVKDLQDDAWKELKFKLKWDKCVKAKDIVLKELEGNFKEEYGLVEGYAKYLNSVNPGNNIKVVTGRDSPNGPLMFRKMYFCLGVIKEGWKRGCRPILGVDGCFLKSITKGVLLTAIGRDGNGGFYPVALAVVQSESLDSWQWFFQLLQSDLELQNGENFTVILDQAQAIISAIKNVLPKAEHSLCDRHIFCNVAKRHGLHDEDLRMRFWNACKATFEKQWEKEMVELYGVSPGAHDEMMLFEKKKTWCRAFYDCHSKCAETTNNITESFNAWIPLTRGKAIISLNEDIMNKLLVWIRDHKRMVYRWDTDLSPKARAKLNFNLDLATSCHVLDAGEGVFKVIDYQHKTVHKVDMGAGECTCRKWQLTGIPCEHVLASAADMDIEPESLVSDYFKKEKWFFAYGKNIEVTRGAEMWNDWQGERPEPPISDRDPGRPRVNRMKPKCGEVKRIKVRGIVTEQLNKVGRIARCSVCGQEGHNKRNKKKCPLWNRDSVGSNAEVPMNQSYPPNESVAGPSNVAENTGKGSTSVPIKRKAPTENTKNSKKAYKGKGKRKAKAMDP